MFYAISHKARKAFGPFMTRQAGWNWVKEVGDDAVMAYMIVSDNRAQQLDYELVRVKHRAQQ